jgi:hypothetical protein
MTRTLDVGFCRIDRTNKTNTDRQTFLSSPKTSRFRGLCPFYKNLPRNRPKSSRSWCWISLPDQKAFSQHANFFLSWTLAQKSSASVTRLRSRLGRQLKAADEEEGERKEKEQKSVEYLCSSRAAVGLKLEPSRKLGTRGEETIQSDHNNRGSNDDKGWWPDNGQVHQTVLVGEGRGSTSTTGALGRQQRRTLAARRRNFSLRPRVHSLTTWQPPPPYSL